jgi:hypothetical protein
MCNSPRLVQKILWLVLDGGGFQQIDAKNRHSEVTHFLHLELAGKSDSCWSENR